MVFFLPLPNFPSARACGLLMSRSVNESAFVVKWACIVAHAVPRSIDSESHMKQAIDKDQVRMLVTDIGYNEASKRLNIPAPTLRQWAHRGKWSVPARTDERVTLVTTPPAVAHASALAEMETETRTSLARSAQRMAKDAEQATLRDSDKVHNVAKTAAIVHRWDAKEQGVNVAVNIALLGVPPEQA